MKLAVGVLCLVCIASASHARFVREAKVRYETSEGKSNWIDVKASFLNGDELNQLTSSVQWSFLKNYAAIFLGKSADGSDKIAVIRLDTPFIICGLRFEESCLPILGRMTGPDQNGRVWEICTGVVC